MRWFRSFQEFLNPIVSDLLEDLRWWASRGIIFILAFFLTLASGVESREYDTILIARWPNWFTRLHPVFLSGVAVTALMLSYFWSRMSTRLLLFGAGMTSAQMIILRGQPHQVSSTIAPFIVYFVVLFACIRRRTSSTLQPPI